MFKRAIPKCTPEQQARQDKCREMGCIACRMESVLQDDQGIWIQQCGHAEIHHLTKSGRQIGQDESVCLGAWHHRSVLRLNGAVTSSLMTNLFGPSLAKGSKTFHARYGSNEELLAYQNKLIGDVYEH